MRSQKFFNFSKIYLFHLLFGWSTAIFQPLSREQVHSTDVNHCVLLSDFRHEGYQETRFLSLTEYPVRFGTANFQFQ